MDRTEYVECVLDLVERIPAGLVSTYGDLAEMVGRGGPRGIGQVMALHGAAVPWWRVVRADGRPAAGHESDALIRLRDEGVKLRSPDRIDLAQARWTGSDHPIHNGNRRPIHEEIESTP